jgi:hypothetical protein
MMMGRGAIQGTAAVRHSRAPALGHRHRPTTTSCRRAPGGGKSGNRRASVWCLPGGVPVGCSSTHDVASRSEEIEQCVREAVAVIVPRVPPAVTRASRHRPSGVSGRVRGGYDVPPSMADAGSAVAALTLGKFLRPSPLMRLGTVGVATVIIVRRAWRRSSRPRQALKVPSGSTQCSPLKIDDRADPRLRDWCRRRAM